MEMSYTQAIAVSDATHTQNVKCKKQNHKYLHIESVSIICGIILREPTKILYYMNNNMM